MKMLPFLLMNLVVVGGGIAAYDHLRADDPATMTDVAAIDPVDLAAMEDRIVERLNSADQPVLRASGVDPRLTARIEALEKHMGARAPVDAGSASPSSSVSEKPAEGFAMPALSEGGEVEPSEDEVKRFRKIMEAAERQRRDEREAERLQQMLARLEIDLNPEQQKQLLEAQRGFRRKMGETMRTAFQGGGGREAAREAMEGLREEYTTTLTKFLSVGDAQKIVENGGMRGFGGFRGRDGGAGAAGRRGR